MRFFNFVLIKHAHVVCFDFSANPIDVKQVFRAQDKRAKLLDVSDDFDAELLQKLLTNAAQGHSDCSFAR